MNKLYNKKSASILNWRFSYYIVYIYVLIVLKSILFLTLDRRKWILKIVLQKKAIQSGVLYKGMNFIIKLAAANLL